MNSKIQSVSFRNVDEFLDYLTVDELKIVKLLRNIIFEGSQHITEKLSYNVPFYKIDKTIFLYGLLQFCGARLNRMKV